MCTPAEFPTTAKGRPIMILDGYLYTQDPRTDTKTLTLVLPAWIIFDPDSITIQ